MCGSITVICHANGKINKEREKGKYAEWLHKCEYEFAGQLCWISKINKQNETGNLCDLNRGRKAFDQV